MTASHDESLSGLQVIPIQNLREAASFLEGEIKIAPTRIDLANIFNNHSDEEFDFADVKGQESVKRALEIAAAGGHNVLTLFSYKPRAPPALLLARWFLRKET